MKDYKLKQRNLRASHTLGWSNRVDTVREIGNKRKSFFHLFSFPIHGHTFSGSRGSADERVPHGLHASEKGAPLTYKETVLLGSRTAV
jgi:hypothetical protein